MNIFYLHSNPKQCAEQHIDKHCVKMILEYAQLLSTAHRCIDGVASTRLSKSGRKQQHYALPDDRDQILYTATHINHPSAIWVRKRESHYQWLFKLWIELMSEYTYRYGRVHATARLIPFLTNSPKNIDRGVGFDDPTPAMPDEYKAKTSIQSYHNYYNGPKAHFAKWTKRPTPSWFNG